MKSINTLFAGLVAGCALALTLPAFAAADKEVTITGMGTCGKCALHETKHCQNVIQVEKDGKTTNYFLTDNKVSDEFHDNICKKPAKVTATGTVTEKDGKMEMTVTKIALVK
ncbi:MAG TPA: DUF6370 family protein [Dongiaceae bacterium]|jgi:hypothetical protein|nr:DUF6370 family protein [Dongiaceae bacterium]